MPILPKEDVPAEIIALVTHYAGLLKLDDWRIYLQMVDHVEGNDGDAQCTLMHDYFACNILICRGFATDHPELLGVVVLHELLHIAMADQDFAVIEIIGLLKQYAPRVEGAALNQWRHGDERTTERLARLLIDLLPKPYK